MSLAFDPVKVILESQGGVTAASKVEICPIFLTFFLESEKKILHNTWITKNLGFFWWGKAANYPPGTFPAVYQPQKPGGSAAPLEPGGYPLLITPVLVR